MKILVTNDDGINAIGIRKLAEALKKLGDVFVIAPDRERSATGHAITMHEPLRVKKVDYYSEEIKAWSINGTPSDCVKLGITSLIPDRPDIVVSGINNGPNLGTDVIYSGTVSAAIEGAINGIPSIALSLAGVGNNKKYEGAASLSCFLVEEYLYKCKNAILNINFPLLDLKQIKGIRITELGIRKYNSSYIKRVDPMGNEYYWLSGELIKNNIIKNSDINAIENGYISITPLHYNLTDFRALKEISQMSKNFDCEKVNYE